MLFSEEINISRWSFVSEAEISINLQKVRQHRIRPLKVCLGSIFGNNSIFFCFANYNPRVMRINTALPHPKNHRGKP